MIDLTTKYLGLKLSNPLVASSSPLSKKVDTVKKMEDAGIGAVVMYSLFEEQITHESKALDFFLERGTNSNRGSHDLLPGSGPLQCWARGISRVDPEDQRGGFHAGDCQPEWNFKRRLG